LVARIHFRAFVGADENILACCAGGKAAYIGHVRT
jgi:hypothetical protein